MKIIMRLVATCLLLQGPMAIADPVVIEVVEKSTGQMTTVYFDTSSGAGSSVTRNRVEELPQVARYRAVDGNLTSDGHIIAPADTLLFQCEVNGVDVVVVRVEHNSLSSPLRTLLALSGHPIQVSTIYVEVIRGRKVISKKEITHKPASYEWSARVLRLAALLLPVSMAVKEEPLSASDVLELITKEGQFEFVEHHYDTKLWSRLLDGIGSGETAWLNVYEALNPHGGQSGEDLDDALYERAFPANPFEVIEIIKKDNADISDEDVCSFEFQVSVPPGGIGKYLDELERNLAHAKTERERKYQDVCLRGIAKARVALANDPGY